MATTRTFESNDRFVKVGDKFYERDDNSGNIASMAANKNYYEVDAPVTLDKLNKSVFSYAIFNEDGTQVSNAASGAGQATNPEKQAGLAKGKTEQDLQEMRNSGELLPAGTQLAEKRADGYQSPSDLKAEREMGASSNRKPKSKTTSSRTDTPQISPEDYKMKPGESVKAYNDRIASARGETSQPQTSIDVITDPVTGRSYSRDLSVPGSTYKPYSGVVPTASSGSIAPPNQTYTDQPGEDAPKSLESIFADYGYAVSEGAKDRFKLAPAASFKEVYNNISKSLGLDKVKREMDDTLEKIGALDQELADKIADVNENPWLSEGVRVSQIRKLEERYDLKRAPYASNLTTLENLWNDGREEARYVATQSLNQYNTEREFQLDQIQEMQDMAERQFEAELKLYEAQRNKGEYTEVSPGATLFDPVTGKAIYTAPTAKTTGGGGSSSSGTIPSAQVTALKKALDASKYSGAEADGKYADPSLYLANYQSYIASGGSAGVFLAAFPPSTYINPKNTWLPQEILNFTKSGGKESLDYPDV